MAFGAALPVHRLLAQQRPHEDERVNRWFPDGALFQRTSARLLWMPPEDHNLRDAGVLATSCLLYTSFDLRFARARQAADGPAAVSYTHLEPGVNKGSNDPDHLGGPANFYVEPATNELFIADGYINKRVVVYDAATGQYKRHWGAYGKRPDDAERYRYPVDTTNPPQQYSTPVSYTHLLCGEMK